MTPEEYRSAIATLGLSQVKAAKFFGANERSSRRWATLGAPADISVALAAMVLLKNLGHDPLVLPTILQAKAWTPDAKKAPA